MQAGPYELLSEIGRGGMGVVWKARSPEGLEVAVKVLTKLSAKRVARFAREVRLNAALGEELGFVPLLDSGETPHGPYLVMPFVGGGTLRDRLARGPLDLDETTRIGGALARAIGEAHARGIVHRDLKPENVLFTAEGRPLVADLGLAKHWDDEAPGASQSVSLSAANETLGSVGYMAPEQLGNAKNAGPPADVFALGAILHECLSGTPCFHADTFFELVQRIEACRVTPVRKLRADVPAKLEAVVTRALAKDPRDRFTDGHHLARALGQGPKAKTPGRRASLLLVVLVLVAVLAVAFAWWLEEESRRAEAPSVATAADLARARHAEVAALAARARQRAQRGDAKGALADWDAALLIEPRTAALLVGRTLALRASGDLARALESADKAVQAAPAEALGWRVRGEVRSALGDPGALTDLDRAIALDPRDARALADRGGLRVDSGEIDAGLPDLEGALALDPKLAVAFMFRGVARTKKGLLDDALSDFTRATELDPHVARAWIALASSEKRRGDNSACRRALERALEIEPENPAARLDRGELRMLDKDWDGGAIDLTHVLAVHPDHYESLLQRGFCRIRLKRYDLAIADEDAAIRIAPNDQRGWFNRAYAEEEKGDLDGALADASKAIEVDARTWAWAIRGLVRAAKGDDEGALSDLRRASRFELDEELRGRVMDKLAELEMNGRH